MNLPSLGRDNINKLAADPALPDGNNAAQSKATVAITAGVSNRAAFLTKRLQSLDVYRGLIMVTLAFTGFGLAETATAHIRAGENAAFWETVRYQFSHVEWTGCGYWDLIQPSFMFMVGVAMAFSYAKRKEMGQSYGRMLAHAMWRSVVLIFLGIFLISNWSRHTEWSLMNVLTQIGLGYTFLFLLWGRSVRTQALAAAAILIGTWLLYVLYPYSGIDLQTGAPSIGVSKVWAQEHLQGIGSAWHKNANVGHAIDLWLLNLLPQSEPFRYNSGGYQTINFIPSLATMLFGLMCGELLRSNRSDGIKLVILVAAGAGGMFTGYLLDAAGICPLVKRIWTPAWALYSTGWCCLILAFLFLVIDVVGFRWWTFPLVVVGVNSIAIYSMSMLLKPWVERTLQIHFGDDLFQRIAALLGDPLLLPAVEATMVGLVFWLMCLWMYRQKIFVRI